MSKEPERGSLGEFELSEKAHGTHGKGDMREHDLGERDAAPGNERAREQLAKNPRDAADKLTGELGDAGWGSAGAGDSSVDARSRKDKGKGGT
jgi:hypothetical protein